MADFLKDSIEKYSTKIKIDQNFAQILVYLNSHLTLEMAREIIRQFGIRVIKSKRFLPNLILLILDTKDMRDVVLKLIENGFLEIKGYNASSFKSKP